MEPTHLTLGAEGEARAAIHLQSRGYRIVDRNVRAGGVELDLVAVRGSILVFVEVKTRRSRRHGAPEESIGAEKRRRLVRGARAWLSEHRPRARRTRFDVITCEPGPSGSWTLRHWEDAFDAGEY